MFHKSRIVFIQLSLLASFAAGIRAASPSSVTLGASPNPSILGQAVTLMAAVTTGATGKVTFYDDTTILGTSTISNSRAIFTTVLLPAGVDHLHAHYLGDSTYAPSNSNVVQQTVQARPSLGLNSPVSHEVCDLPGMAQVADFNGDGKQDLVVVCGSVAQLLLGKGDGSFQPATTIATGNSEFGSVVVADFNNDGNADLVYYLSSFGFDVQLGNGDGTFGPLTYVPINDPARALVVADFNGDGKADIGVLFYGSVGILLGNGDGTFQPAVTYGVNDPSALVVADFNGDGIPDLATEYLSSSNGTSVQILIGVGDGTFQTPVTYQVGSIISYTIVAADFNGDGKIDLLAPPNVLLGNGDGTFGTPTNLLGAAYDGAGGPSAQSVTVGDINGDEKLDLIFVGYNYPTANVLLGNGDGTFQAALSYPTAYPPCFTSVGDFNGDGKTDVAVVMNGWDEINVFLGGAVPDLSISLSNGPGFSQGQTGASYFITVSSVGAATSGSVSVIDTLPSGFTATSITGSGWTCTLATLTCTRSDSLFTEGVYPDIIVTGNIAGTLTGTIVNSATVSGGGDQNLSNNTAVDSVTIRMNPSVSMTSSPNPSTLGQAVTLSAMLAPAATGRVTFSSGTAILGDAAVTNGQASLVTQILPAGANRLLALYSGDSAYASAASPVRLQTVTEALSNGVNPPTTYNVDTFAQHVIIADLNADGKPDVVTAETLSGVAVALGNGDGTFREAGAYEVPGAGSTVGAADFNRDGITDIVVGNATGVYILIGNGDGTFKLAVASSSNVGTYDLVIADVNMDGNPDIVTSDGDANTEILLGKGDGTFQPPRSLSSNPVSDISVTDFNGDGKPDLLLCSFPPTVLLGSGDGSFQAPIVVPTPNGGASAFAVGDFNGDGKTDIAMVSNGALAVAIGNGDGTFQNPISTSISNATPAYFLVAGDFNGDGKLDVAFRPNGANYLAFAFGKGDGTFQPAAVTFATAGWATEVGENIAVGDLNGDGRPDLVVTNIAAPVQIFLSGQFSAASVASVHNGAFVVGQGGYTYQLTVGNPTYFAIASTVTVTDTLPAGLTATAISGSGWSCTLNTLSCMRSDALSSGNSYPPITLTVSVSGSSPGTVSNQVSVSYAGNNNMASDPTRIVLASTTTLNVSPAGSILGQPVTLTASVSAGATGKVTFRDGVSPVGVATIAGGQAVLKTYLLPAGSRSLTAFYTGDSTHGTSVSAAKPYTVASSQANEFAPAIANSVGNGASGIAMADFNLDGVADLATANLSGSVSILTGNGDGTFKPSLNIPVGGSAGAIVAGDFNGDGKPDMAIASPSASGVIILLGNGNGTFQPPATYPAGNGAGAIAAGDFNGDGITDLAVVNLSDSSLSVLLGGGDGTFKQSSIFPLSGPLGSVSISVADFNGDSKPDLFVLSDHSFQFTFLGNGDGTFSESNVFPACGEAGTVADFNGDGLSDAACSNVDGVSIWLGQANGTLTFHSFYELPNVSTAPPVVVADVNGDGKLDVVLGNAPLTVLLGNGDGTLQSPISFPLSSQPVQMVAADFNGDGRTDIATVNGNVSVLLGALARLVEVSSTHIGEFVFNSTGVYTLTITNVGPGSTAGTVTVVDTLPAGTTPASLTASAISGTGWNCTLTTVTCSRSDSLGVGASYPPILLTVNVGSYMPEPPLVDLPALNIVTVSGGGSIAETGTDSTYFTAGPPYPNLISPLNGAVAASLNPTLTWAPSTGATSYWVYFGTSSSPQLFASVTGTSYATPPLAAGTTYYWQIVAENAAGGNPSAIWSFTTATVGSKVGIWRPSVFNMVAQDVDGNIGWDAPPDRANFFGATGDIVIFGDWNGTGQSCMGIFRPSVAMFALDMNCNGAWDPGVDTFGFFGQNGDIPIVGDWTGDGRSKIGIFRPTTGLFALDINNNLTWDPGIDQAGKFGQPNDVPIVGKWTLDGKSKVGIFRNGLWELDTNGNLGWEPGFDSSGTIGQAGDTPLLGDWNGDGRTKVGIYRSSSAIFGLDYNGNLIWDNGVDRGGLLGPPGATPVVGDWTGTGISRVGIFYGNGYWALDTNGNLVWDAGIKWGAFGAAGDTPVVGKWQ